MKEETLRQKSWAIWIHASDNNSKKCHRFANQRRLSNSIWEMKGEQEEMVCDTKLTKQVTVSHFKGLFEQKFFSSLESQLKV